MWWCSEDESYWIDLNEVVSVWFNKSFGPTVDYLSIRLRELPVQIEETGGTDKNAIHLNDEDAESFHDCWQYYVKKYRRVRAREEEV